jgi:hypothetical protein
VRSIFNANAIMRALRGGKRPKDATWTDISGAFSARGAATDYAKSGSGSVAGRFGYGQVTVTVAKSTTAAPRFIARGLSAFTHFGRNSEAGRFLPRAAASTIKRITSSAAGRALRFGASTAGALLPAGSEFASLTLSPAVTGAQLYTATVYPLEDDVPAGSTIISDDDSTLRASVLSAWPNGSAAVVVLAGEKTFPTLANQTISLKAGTPPGGTNLTTARIDLLLTDVSVNIPTVGSVTFSNWAAPLRVWWANPQIIVAQYVFDVGTMQASVYVHAFNSQARAFVEVVIENGKINAAGSPVAPSTKVYTNATVTLTPTGGSSVTLATVTSVVRGTPVLSSLSTVPLAGEWTVDEFSASPPSSPTGGYTVAIMEGPSGAFAGHAGERAVWGGSSWTFTAAATGRVAALSPSVAPYIWTGSAWAIGWIGGHDAFRSWYCSGWVNGTTATVSGGAADPRVEVTHDAASLQAHPWFWKMPAASSDYSSTYSADAYTPFGTGRLNVPNMGGTGDVPAIGMLPQWDAHYVQTGSKYARRASIATALSALSCNVSYRDTGGAVPTFTQLGSKDMPHSTWPRNVASEPLWEQAHQPAIGLVAFLCRPSPRFIELSQQIALWNKAWGDAVDGGGVYEFWYQTRGKAWCYRAHGHAIFLTPAGDAWKSPAQTVLDTAFSTLDLYRTDSKQQLNICWNYIATYAENLTSPAAGRGFQQAMWMTHFLVQSLHGVASSKVLTGSAQDRAVTLADYFARQPVRYINEALFGEWRIQFYQTSVGSDPAHGGTIGSLSTWGAQMDWRFTDTAAVTGPWKEGVHDGTLYSTAITDPGGATYSGMFWSALVCAVERGVTGSAQALATVNANITGRSTWDAGFVSDPRHGYIPRVSYSTSWAPAAGQYADASTVTPQTINPCPGGTNEGCFYSSVQGFEGIWAVWNGGIYAPLLGSAGSLLMFGGGHTAYWNNQIVRFDIATRAHSLLGPVTSYAPNALDIQSDQQTFPYAGRNVDFDGSYPDGTPYPNHTNMGQAYLPPEAGGGTLGSYCFVSHDQTEVLINNPTLWRYDLALGAWSKEIDGIAANGSTPGLLYDPNRKGLWCIGGGNGELTFLNVIAGTKAVIGVGSAGGKINTSFLGNGTYVPGRDGIVIGTQFFGLWWLSLASLPANPVAGTWTTTGLQTINQSGTKAPNMWWDDVPGTYNCDLLEYCPLDGNLYTLDWRAAEDQRPTVARLYKLTPPAAGSEGSSAWTWTNEVCSPKASEVFAVRGTRNDQTAGRDRGWYGRFRYVPAIKSFIYSDSSYEMVQAIRPAAFT